MAEGKARRAPPRALLSHQRGLSLTAASAVSSPALQQAALAVQQACWLHLPGETREASRGGQAVRCLWQLLLKHLENSHRLSVLGMEDSS